MRFIVMHKVDEKMESGAPPSKDTVERMGKLVSESLKSGIFKDGAGLHRSAWRVRLRYRNGDREVTRGPYAGENELISSFAMVRAKSIETAMEIADRFARVFGDCEIEVGLVVEPWDLGIGVPAPEGPRDLRFLLLHKGETPTVDLAPLKKALSEEGLLLSAASLAPSKQGMRLTGSKSKRTWMDGPFAESKELIAGFSILEMPSMDGAKAWADRYAEILEDNEVDVRPLIDTRSSESAASAR